MPSNGFSMQTKKTVVGKQFPLAEREVHVKTPVSSPTRNNSAHYVDSNQTITIPLSVHIKVKTPKVTSPVSKSQKSPLQQAIEDKWMHQSIYKQQRVGVPNKANLVVNSCRRGKDQKGKLRSHNNSASLKPQSSGESLKKCNVKGVKISTPNNTPRQSADSTEEKAAKNTETEKNAPSPSPNFLERHPNRCRNQYIAQQLYTPPMPKKGFILQEDGKFKTCNIVPIPVFVDDDRGDPEINVPIPKSMSCMKDGSPVVKDPQPTKKQKPSRFYSCLSDSNILRIAENEVNRFESFGTLPHTIQKRQKPVNAPTSKVPKMKAPAATSTISNYIGNNGDTWQDRNRHVKIPNMTFSDVLSGIGSISGRNSAESMHRSSSKNSSPRSVVSPTLSLTKSELKVWNNQSAIEPKESKGDIKRKNVHNKKSKSSADSAIRQNTPNMWIKNFTEPKINGNKGKGTKARSPRVIQSKSLYDYRTLVL